MTTSTYHEYANAGSLLPSRRVIWLVRALCFTALCISGYLAWTAFNASPVYGCGGGEVFDCGHVLNSQYSKVFGIPVSVPAFSLYASLLVVLAIFRPGISERLLKAGWAVFTVGAIAAGLAAVYFTSIQVFQLEHLCAYCLGTHSCGIILAAIVLWKRPLGMKATSLLSSFSVAGVAGMVAAQVLVTPPDTFVVERFDDESSEAELELAGFDAPVSFDAPENFDAPMAPAEFDAPVEFGPPSDDDALFEPPADTETIVTPVEESNEPTVVAEKPGVDVSEVEPLKADVISTTPEPTVEVEEEPKDVVPAVAASAMLFFSPTATTLVSKFFSDDTGSEKSESDEKSTATPLNKAKPVAKTKTTAIPQKLVPVAGRKFSLNTRHWPLLGKPDAKYVFVEMFDYTCSHCRHTAHAIDGAFQRYGDDLAIIALPVPIDPACNDAISSTGHAGACELAKLSVAVWRCDSNKFREYHNWMFQSHRSSTAARQKAYELVGKARMDAELALPHAKNYVAKHIELYKRVGRGAVPKLLFPSSTMTGQVSSSSTLVSAIERELGR